MFAAIARGAPDWRGATVLIWLHLATIMAALVLTPLLLLMPRGVRRHRVLGYAWVLAMMTTAALSFWIRTINPGGFSAIHLLSALTLVAAPTIAWRAHRHDVRRHRIAAVTLTAAALLIAGFFTFPFARLLGRWLFA